MFFMVNRRRTRPGGIRIPGSGVAHLTFKQYYQKSRRKNISRYFKTVIPQQRQIKTNRFPAISIFSVWKNPANQIHIIGSKYAVTGNFRLRCLQNIGSAAMKKRRVYGAGVTTKVIIAAASVKLLPAKYISVYVWLGSKVTPLMAPLPLFESSPGLPVAIGGNEL